MGYNNNRTSPFHNYYSDGCGSTNNEKYYVNGTFIDLCGLSVEEYMKNPCCCTGSGNNNQEGVKITNSITIKSFENEDDVIYYQAFSKFPVTSNLKVTVYSTNGNATELDLYVGDTESQPEIGESVEIKSVDLNPASDDNYDYVVTIEEMNEEYTIYTATSLNKEGVDFSEILVPTIMKMGTTSDIHFIIPATDLKPEDFEEDEDYVNFCKENHYCFVLCIPKNIYDKKQYIISNYGGTETTDKFKFVEELIINDISYVLLKEGATTEDEIFEYVPIYQEEHDFAYKLTLNK